jgi:hypothetical protein
MFGNAEREAVLRAKRAMEAEKNAADAEAAIYLAQLHCPPDVVAFGNRHKIPEFAKLTWNAGFIQGWRAAQSQKLKEAYGEIEDGK